VQDAPAPAAPVAQEPAPVREAPAQPPAAQPEPQAPAQPPAARPEPQAPAAPEPSAPTAAPDSGAAAQILALVNKERAAVGCPALTVNEQLAKAAQAHSEDMASHTTMSHTGSDGSDPGERITRAGYEWRTYGENVAYGYSTAEQVMQGWMNSPGHRQNILNCAFKEIGVGLAQPNHYWTQDFGASR
ncbi:CAP domain-containing protein, partial [Streptomyces sp. WAC05292]|uniref:CAP domain-containing protein n=1 Tax=Streptomyces sp. WAC05292 TaxID=2487418 RepID=UPI000FC25D33